VNRGSCISSIPRIASAAKDHEHDIHNARPSNPVYTGPKFNSLLGLPLAALMRRRSLVLLLLSAVSAGLRRVRRLSIRILVRGHEVLLCEIAGDRG
ncbi:hypothetical protein, partial [Paraburkholderia sp. BR14374]|uniref:hypothetical protein n=1 Tax=Paraburkholderia sp. BR14374 TaxID=3237007 RepID=UPI0034CF05C0